MVSRAGIEPHKPYTADFTTSCALTSSDVDPATTDSVRVQSAANYAAEGASSFGESNPRGRRDNPRKYIAETTHDEGWCVSRADLPPKPYGFDSRSASLTTLINESNRKLFPFNILSKVEMPIPHCLQNSCFVKCRLSMYVNIRCTAKRFPGFLSRGFI